MSLSSNKIAFGKQLLEERKTCVAWHQQTLRRGKGAYFVFLRCTYGFPNPFLFDYKCILQGPEHLNFTPNQSSEPVQIFCIVEHIVCLIREDVAGYAERIKQTRCRQANER